MMTRDQFETLRQGWTLPKGCSGAGMKDIPGTTGYPTIFAELRLSGSAQVMVRINADGSVESAHAVCASDSAFAEAAVATAKAISYDVARCDGKAIPSAILLPFTYHFE
jgi:outer membrane biosynthesis protein TonB